MKILVIQLRRIGDTLLATPAVEALRRAHPQAQIDFLVEPPCDQVLEGNPHVSRVLVYDSSKAWAWVRRIRAEGYDWVVDFLGNPRSAALTALSGAKVKAGPGRRLRRLAYTHPFPSPKAPLYAAQEKLDGLAALGVKGLDRPRPVVRPSPQRQARAKQALAGLGSFVALAPSSRRATRAWPAASFGRLARLIKDQSGLPSLVLWGPGERETAQAVVRDSAGAASLAPETPHLMDLAALLEQSSAVAANCNGPKHLAVGLGLPTLTLHFSSDPAAWNPPADPKHLTARAEELHCIGCRLNACPYALECMKLLTPERALEAFLRLPLVRRDGALR